MDVVAADNAFHRRYEHAEVTLKTLEIQRLHEKSGNLNVFTQILQKIIILQHVILTLIKDVGL